MSGNKYLAAVLIGGLSYATSSVALAQQPAAAELQGMSAAEGLKATVFASEPLISNPSAIDVDTNDRVWVAQIDTYHSLPDGASLGSIKVLEDTDGDGQADKSTVFAEGLGQVMSICVAGKPRLRRCEPGSMGLYG